MRFYIITFVSCILILLPIHSMGMNFSSGMSIVMNWVHEWGNSIINPTNKESILVFVHENGDTDHSEDVILTYADISSTEMPIDQIIASKVESFAGRSGKIFTETGAEITSGVGLTNATRLFFVDEGRVFIWPSFELGHRAVASTVKLPWGYDPIVLETLSTSPRVFRIYNFFTEDESNKLIENALQLTEEEYRLKRSSTGTNGYSIDDKRTSENAFDTTSPVAMRLKKRCFDLLGIHPYEETWADGLQILRYNQTTAYINHLDYIESDSIDHDWDSAGTGTNRFATILLYLTGVDDGGETFFPEAKEWYARDAGKEKECANINSRDCTGHVERATMSTKQARENTTEYLESHNISHLFPENRSKMAVRPVKAEALLFYSQHPDGEVDRSSMHGGCPVLQGVKWAANLWVWNGPRQPYLFRERRKNGQWTPPVAEPEQLTAVFENNEVEGPVELYWNDQPMGDLLIGHPVSMNTFAGHKFSARLHGQTLMQFVIKPKAKSGSAVQKFTLTRSDDDKGGGKSEF